MLFVLSPYHSDYIVNEDAHFRVLKSIFFPAICVIRLEQFPAEISK